eukprot:30859-Pelagococcus_subviridis.AAC.3
MSAAAASAAAAAFASCAAFDSCARSRRARASRVLPSSSSSSSSSSFHLRATRRGSDASSSRVGFSSPPPRALRRPRRRPPSPPPPRASPEDDARGGGEAREDDDDDDDTIIDRNLRALTFVACLSMVAFGAATGSIAGALVVLERGTTSLGVMSTTCKSVVVACTPLGALVGALLASVASRSGLGRRDSLLLNDLLYLLGAAAMALSSSFAWLTAGRFVVGLAVGVSTSVCTMYVSECAPARTRGRLAASAPLAGTVGILASYVLSLAVRSVHWFPYDPVGVVNADP